MSKQLLPEGLTPEQVMELGHEMRKAVVATLTDEELAGLPPKKRLAELAPEDRLAGLAPEELEKLMVKSNDT